MYRGLSTLLAMLKEFFRHYVRESTTETLLVLMHSVLRRLMVFILHDGITSSIYIPSCIAKFTSLLYCSKTFKTAELKWRPSVVNVNILAIVFNPTLFCAFLWKPLGAFLSLLWEILNFYLRSDFWNTVAHVSPLNYFNFFNDLQVWVSKNIFIMASFKKSICD